METRKEILLAKQQARKEFLSAPFKVGDYAMCWYPKIKNCPISEYELELYYCKILWMGNGDYCTVEMYWGETFQPTRVKGKFNDICILDLVKFEG